MCIESLLSGNVLCLKLHNVASAFEIVKFTRHSRLRLFVSEFLRLQREGRLERVSGCMFVREASKLIDGVTVCADIVSFAYEKGTIEAIQLLCILRRIGNKRVGLYLTALAYIDIFEDRFLGKRSPPCLQRRA